MALLWKMICNLRDPISLRHPVPTQTHTKNLLISHETQIYAAVRWGMWKSGVLIRHSHERALTRHSHASVGCIWLSVVCKRDVLGHDTFADVMWGMWKSGVLNRLTYMRESDIWERVTHTYAYDRESLWEEVESVWEPLSHVCCKC